MNEDIQSVGEEGEKIFAEICNELDCEFLFIAQTQKGFSSKMWQTKQKRPDYLANIADVAPIFIDVKVRTESRAGSTELKNVRAFSENFSSFKRMCNFEDNIGISTWYAFLRNTNRGISTSQAYLIPLSRIEKNIPDHIRQKEFAGELTDEWIIGIPIDCMNVWNPRHTPMIDLSDKCRGCQYEYCKVKSK